MSILKQLNDIGAIVEELETTHSWPNFHLFSVF